MADKRTGPFLRVTATCSGCKYERTKGYRCQGDSGRDVYCDHPSSEGRHVGDTKWDTPDWCPEGAAMISARAALQQGPGQ